MTTADSGKDKFWLGEPEDFSSYISPDEETFREVNEHGLWAPLNCQGHSAFALMVWRMEGDTRSKECENRANQVVGMLNRHDKLVDLLRRFMNPNSDIEKAFEEAEDIIKEVGLF